MREKELGISSHFLLGKEFSCYREKCTILKWNISNMSYQSLKASVIYENTVPLRISRELAELNQGSLLAAELPRLCSLRTQKDLFPWNNNHFKGNKGWTSASPTSLRLWKFENVSFLMKRVSFHLKYSRWRFKNIEDINIKWWQKYEGGMSLTI